MLGVDRLLRWGLPRGIVVGVVAEQGIRSICEIVLSQSDLASHVWVLWGVGLQIWGPPRADIWDLWNAHETATFLRYSGMCVHTTRYLHRL
ncbi:uncharacterized protein B0I36DRAFT_329038 [Microdochium trichocladiopsis]|uniref:Uncharacterized protein n=1 Tax=Microdochium trichocladiopsis TaxID=1682393 RepID=A0A9P8XZ11_9PEZI|nr:uncharacterized protein B0I36DRAFT_329038 [Microdochium trichocladiopsis]KAH7025742.1 hypothetical protein B0I36DRAFT_329038 [Microdochium trichocladiopsis]